jgi:hypothetical protein
MKKLSTRKILLWIIVLVIIGFVAYSGTMLHNEVKANEREIASLSDTTITASDVSPYLTGIVQIGCSDSSASGGDAGSGSLWNLPKLGYTVLTNEHVIDDDGNGAKNEGVPDGFDQDGKPLTIKDACAVSLPTDLTTNDEDEYYIDLAGKYQWNKEADAADLPIRLNTGDDTITSSTLPVSSLNYSISNVPLCPAAIPVGSPVAAIGYPAFGDAATSTPDSTPQDYEITTMGVISGILTNDINTGAALTYPDFFVSALIDSGSSGGIAFSKNANGLCVLGIPTWINAGNYESEGVVQNIRNIFLKE